jgi:hypothetical protein
MELSSTRYRVRSLAGRCDHCPAVNTALRVTGRDRHIDLTRSELTWLYTEAFGIEPSSKTDDANMMVSIQMLKGFAWAVRKIEDRRNESNLTEGGSTQ